MVPACRPLTTCVQAAKRFGIRCFGIEYEAKFVDRARKAVAEAGVSHLVEVYHADALAMDWPAVTTLFLYLTPTGIQRAMPKLTAAADSGARIVASVFSVCPCATT